MSGIKAVYWDSCLFLDWLQGRKREPYSIEGLKEQIEGFKHGELVISTSVITFTEVLRSGIEPDKYNEFIKLFSRRYVQPLQVTLIIARLAGELREHYAYTPIAPNTIARPLSTPDSLHIATCIAQKISVFYTYDGMKNGTNKDKTLPLLMLGGKMIAEKYPLQIMKPPLGKQSELGV